MSFPSNYVPKHILLFGILGLLLTTPSLTIAQSGNDRNANSEIEESQNSGDIERIESSIDEALSIIESGELEQSLQVLAGAIELSLDTLGEEHPLTLEGVETYAMVLADLDRHTEAEQMLAQTLRLRRENFGEKHPDSINSLNDYALVVYALGMQSETDSSFAEVLRLRREVLGETHPDTFDSRSAYASFLQETAQYAKAEPLFSEQLALRRETLGERHPGTLDALRDYALVVEALGRGFEAIRLFSEVLNLRREVLGDAHPDTIDSLNDYANDLAGFGRDREAEPLYAETLRLSREALGEKHPDTILYLSNYAFALDDARSEPLHAEALRLSREVLGERHPDTIAKLSNYASALEANRAEALFVEALQLSREMLGERHPDTISIMENYAACLSDLGRIAESERLYSEALLLRREVLGETHTDTTIAAFNLAKARIGSPDFADLALEPARMAVTGIDSLFARKTAQDQKGVSFLNSLRPIVREAGQMLASAAWQSSLRNPRAANDLRLEAFTSLQNASAGSTSRAIAKRAAARYASGQEIAQIINEREALEESWTQLDAQLVAAQSGGAKNAGLRTRLGDQLESVDQRILEIDEIIRRQAPQYFEIASQPALELSEIQDILLADEAALLIVPTEHGTHLMTVTSEGHSWELAALSSDDIAIMVADLRAGLEVGPEGELGYFDSQTAHSLYQQLIAPISNSLAGKSHLYVVADGSLSQLPLGVLVTAEPERQAGANADDNLDQLRWFADDFALIQIPSLQAFAYLRTYSQAVSGSGRTLSSEGYAGFGDPVLDGESELRGSGGTSQTPIQLASLAGSDPISDAVQLMNPDAIRRLARLSGTRLELENVAQAFDVPDGSLVLGAQMTEQMLRSSDFSSTKILHFATHGLTALESGKLAEPGLVFTPPVTASLADDGYLAASEIVSLNLTATEWIILSACNTAAPAGVDDGEGFSGLARAFFYAGAESLLVSHWPVFDDIAAQLVVVTLRQSESGKSRAEALQAAMHEIRNDASLEAEHPAVWAPFSLVGEGR